MNNAQLIIIISTIIAIGLMGVFFYLTIKKYEKNKPPSKRKKIVKANSKKAKMKEEKKAKRKFKFPKKKSKTTEK